MITMCRQYYTYSRSLTGCIGITGILNDVIEMVNFHARVHSIIEKGIG